MRLAHVVWFMHCALLLYNIVELALYISNVIEIVNSKCVHILCIYSSINIYTTMVFINIANSILFYYFMTIVVHNLNVAFMLCVCCV